MKTRMQSWLTRLSQKTLKLSAMQIIVLAFLGIVLSGGLLLLLPISSRSGASCGLLTALFTATSATCVTGLSLVDSWTQWSAFGQVILLCLIQIGGLGFMTIASTYFFLFKRKINLRQRLVMAQAMSVNEIGGVVRLVRHVLVVTITIELAGAVILALRLIPDVGVTRGIWWGIFHSVSAFCNAGFDLMGGLHNGSSITAYAGDWVVNITIMALIILGGLGFVVWEDFGSCRSFKRMTVYSKLVIFITVFLIVGGTAAFWLLERSNPATLANRPFAEQILLAMFQSVTCRTAGFWTMEQSALTEASKAVGAFLMFIGGSSGSTAGGLKTATFGVLVLAVISTARGSSNLTVFKRTIAKNQVTSAMSLFGVMLGLIFFGAVFITASNQIPFIDTLYETVSALATVGVTTGITSTLGLGAKLLLMAYMFFGRVGIMTISLGFLFRNRAADRYRYAEAAMLIG